LDKGEARGVITDTRLALRNDLSSLGYGVKAYSRNPRRDRWSKNVVYFDQVYGGFFVPANSVVPTQLSLTFRLLRRQDVLDLKTLI